MLSLDLKVGQSVEIGDGTTIRLKHRSGQRVQLVIDTTERPILVHKDGRMPPRRKPEPDPKPLPEAALLPFRRGAYWGLSRQVRIA